jgi:hypothetical protein
VNLNELSKINIEEIEKSLDDEILKNEFKFIKTEYLFGRTHMYELAPKELVLLNNIIHELKNSIARTSRQMKRIHNNQKRR